MAYLFVISISQRAVQRKKARSSVNLAEVSLITVSCMGCASGVVSKESLPTARPLRAFLGPLLLSSLHVVCVAPVPFWVTHGPSSSALKADGSAYGQWIVVATLVGRTVLPLRCLPTSCLKPVAHTCMGPPWTLHSVLLVCVLYMNTCCLGYQRFRISLEIR